MTSAQKVTYENRDKKFKLILQNIVIDVGVIFKEGIRILRKGCKIKC
ncbi:MAG: hypothetical protein ACI9LE_002103 [Paraglaciecola sp.]|jgi:hypothetical protein